MEKIDREKELYLAVNGKVFTSETECKKEERRVSVEKIIKRIFSILAIGICVIFVYDVYKAEKEIAAKMKIVDENLKEKELKK